MEAAGLISEDRQVRVSMSDLELLFKASELGGLNPPKEISDSLRRDVSMAIDRIKRVSMRPRSPTMPSPRLNFRNTHNNDHNSASAGFAHIRPNRSSIPPALESPGKIVKRKRPSKTGTELSGYGELNLTDTAKLNEYYENRFNQLQQLNCKEIAKAWIKAVEPKKQSQYPYNSKHSNKGKRPPWWPNHCAYIEPDHLKKPDRVRLLVAMLNLRLKPISVYEKATRDVPNRMQNPDSSLPLLEELYMVAKAAERLYNEGDTCPIKTVRIGRSAEAVRNAKKLKDEQQMYVERIVQAQIHNFTLPASPPHTPSADSIGHSSPSPSPHPHQVMSIREMGHSQQQFPPAGYAPPTQHMLVSQGYPPYTPSPWSHDEKISPHSAHGSQYSAEDHYQSEQTPCSSVVTPSTAGFPGMPYTTMDGGMPSSSAEDYSHAGYAPHGVPIGHGYDMAAGGMPQVSHGQHEY